MRDSAPGPVIYETPGGLPIYAWVKGVPFEDLARVQVERVARLPFVHHHVAVMPDVHAGLGCTVGAVIATRGAILPATVGVDIGCGMVAARTTLRADQLPDSLRAVRAAIEAAVPHGRTDHGGRYDEGSWRGEAPPAVREHWEHLQKPYRALIARHPRLSHRRPEEQLGTLGTGNHFVELCVDEADRVWVMLHSGSRGPGNAIGQYFIETARRTLEQRGVALPDRDLAWVEEGSELFDDYVEAVHWAQTYARVNRQLMVEATLRALRQHLPTFKVTDEAVNCHHNYVARETHYGAAVWVTRKGAVRAGAGELGIIPGSMGARSYIVRGRGNPESFCTCSHGAGRAMSRNEAKRRFTLADHRQATAGVECRKDPEVLDETPAAYKDIDAVMAAQSDLVEVVHTLRPVVCVKG